MYSASGARRARSVSGDNYDNEISAQSLSADEKYAILDSVVETMVFHDEMNRYLKFIDSTLRVTAGRDGKEVPSGYYTVTASGSNAFRVEVDLVNLFNTGIIDYEDLTDENPITVTYEAVVTDDAIQGTSCLTKPGSTMENMTPWKVMSSIRRFRPQAEWDGECSRVWDSCLWAQRQQRGREKEACRSDTEIDVEGRNPR